MLGLSRWAGKGGSYRTVQRFFNAVITWPNVFSKFFMRHLYLKSILTAQGKGTVYTFANITKTQFSPF